MATHYNVLAWRIPGTEEPGGLPSVWSHRVRHDWSDLAVAAASNEHQGLISFRMDWLDLFAVQGILKSLLQHHSSKASILRCSAFFTVQLSHAYMTTGKTIALTRWTFVGKVMSLLFFSLFIYYFNMLSRLVITFLPRSKSLLISWLQSPSAGMTVTCSEIIRKWYIRFKCLTPLSWYHFFNCKFIKLTFNSMSNPQYKPGPVYHCTLSYLFEKFKSKTEKSGSKDITTVDQSLEQD